MFLGKIVFYALGLKLFLQRTFNSPNNGDDLSTGRHLLQCSNYAKIYELKDWLDLTSRDAHRIRHGIDPAAFAGDGGVDGKNSVY